MCAASDLYQCAVRAVLCCALQAACDACHITLNKNAVVGDLSAMNPGGVRIGTPAMTSRGLKESDWETIGDFLHEVRPCVCVHARVCMSCKVALCCHAWMLDGAVLACVCSSSMLSAFPRTPGM